MASTRLQIPSSDGYALEATRFVPSGAPRGVVLMHSATATPQTFYADFAGYLAQEGFETGSSPEPFRRDLLAHLNVITLRVPPLRDYAEDVPDLLRYYVDRLVDEQHLPLRRFSVAAQNRLRNYPWPGNVGELKNLVQRVLILGAGEEIRLEEIERELAVKMAVDEPLVKQDLLALPLREAREQFERVHLSQQLASHISRCPKAGLADQADRF